MFVSMTVIEDELARFVQNYADDRGSLLELLRFLGKHPYTRFSRAAIILALKKQGILVDRGLKYLIANGVVSTETENKIQLYSLKTSDDVGNWALALVALDWRQWQSVLRNVVYAE
jgi:hypothetical protein